MDYKAFIDEQIASIRESVGGGLAINALSGGVDSSVVTVLGHRALGDRLKTVFIDNALMREGEPQRVVADVRRDGHPGRAGRRAGRVPRRAARADRPGGEAQGHHRHVLPKVFGRLVRETGAKFLLHGTILTDIEETVAGIKRQHNILAQLGIDPQKEYGYQVLEPLETLRKDGVREVARAAGACRPSIAERMPFPGPALATRIVGEVTAERLATVRAATAIVEEELADTRRVPVHGRAAGRQGHRASATAGASSARSSWSAASTASTRARPRRSSLPWAKLQRICERITAIPGVNRCLYDLTPKPPATIEYV